MRLQKYCINEADLTLLEAVNILSVHLRHRNIQKEIMK